MCLGATGLILADKLAGLPTVAFAPLVHVPSQGKKHCYYYKNNWLFRPPGRVMGGPQESVVHNFNNYYSREITVLGWLWSVIIWVTDFSSQLQRARPAAPLHQWIREAPQIYPKPEFPSSGRGMHCGPEFLSSGLTGKQRCRQSVGGPSVL